VSAAIAPITAITWDDGIESTKTNEVQNAEINGLRTDVTRLQEQIKNIQVPNDPIKLSKVRPGFCACIAKDNAVVEPERKFIDCPAKNFACDKESREICDAKHPTHDC